MNDRLNSEKHLLIQPNSRAANLILEIGHLIEDTHFMLSRPGLVVKFGIDEARDYLKRKEVYLRRQELKRLEKKRIIIRKKIANDYWVSFSKAGFEEHIAQLSVSATDLPDNQVCIVSFDIPESERKLHSQVRHLLKRLGFQQMHRSVWFSRKNVSNYIKKLFTSRFKADNWFKVFIAYQS
ncbi:MAG: hypothetical protein ACD_66C00024G0002 [uncultured bacterium]|uniref:Phenylacetic acid degradation operon negative regulatory protein PaaX n=1 Tax=Candidatus Uhrbacteria bacterium GW2011_GWC1_41_20 TaxID=1618983 RepID=A0A0G0VCN7_9BACT|nr:MAG: hypothetical protein ACD_66C00024G0002 [uncultured bacterium]KKR22427.1 MAG: Phenylacetic acid degradation operon negative regulatory protein PaaX [Candidatus Uhrbacteria bacterium GW2011_GWE1_39_46]KKR63748.1 MAG: Phenylacetic acid degradation operon negative regulatory protein PaaX [Candidatus Uhrbacteria bacterium GW2011_GWC2_40_450]KKR89805.1 MAG: Phenylacetic acid degradation operon negative regulatory protein PaaX [Candidatus Uhrbacteria bacterium GW2011_GWE2_41_1153]KKR89873.1 MA